MSVKSLIIVVVGPTASGKSNLAVKIAKYLRSRTSTNCEIISADSRQVYRGLRIGTGKVPRDKTPKSSILNSIFLHQGIPHHLLDIASPKRQYTAADFQKDAQEELQKVLTLGHIPIICGGTGHYIDALVYDYVIPNVLPNKTLRKKLEKKSDAELFAQLEELDPVRAKNIDQFNRRRLIRAMEIVLTTKKPVPSLELHSYTSPYNIIIIGIKLPEKILRERITKRLRARIKQGMIREVSLLHKNGLSWMRMESLGLEYRYISRYLRGFITKKEMIALLEREIWHYAKRQMTWFKRNQNVQWISKPKQAMLLVKKFFS